MEGFWRKTPASISATAWNNRMMVKYYENDSLEETSSLIRAFGLEGLECPVLSVVGGGGKTTTLHRLADEYVSAGQKVVVTTTTHVFMENSPWFLADPSEDEIRKCMEKYGQVWAGRSAPKQRLKMLPEEILEDILTWNVPVLIEADGARRKPLKVPASHEPVIHPKTTHVISVYGMDSIGKQFKEICFRPELAEMIVNKKGTDPVTVEDIAALAASDQAGRKSCPAHAVYRVVLNKADNRELRREALKICRLLAKAGVDKTVVSGYGMAEIGRREQMKILIRGAGDLATGIASRLYGAGHTILMTEIGTPLTVRRTVALSRTVYDGSAQVEDMKGILAENQEMAEKIIACGDIAVMVDPEASCREWFQPDVIVDAILAKKNLGTKITDAPFVIGIGPGFTAGEDCNCVVETKRGHTLGNIIWKGSAIPNTGVPGNVGGYTIERLIRAGADGEIEPKAEIGDCVEKGQVVALTGGVPVRAQMSGVVRGMLQKGAHVWKNLKIGDIDARAEISHCYTISDKARAIGGGVLEAVSGFERMRERYAIVILAAGSGTRFGGNKLHAYVKNRPLYAHMLEKASAFGGFPVYLVTGDGRIAEDAEAMGITVLQNPDPDLGISHSLKIGLSGALEQNPDIDGVLFSVCDQPGLQVSTIQKILNTGARHPGRIVCAGREVRPGNPVLWDKKYFPDLMKLSGDRGGRQIMGNYKDKLMIVQTEPEELRDIDRREDLTEEG